MTPVDWSEAIEGWSLRCPACRTAALKADESPSIGCGSCGARYSVEDGVARLMAIETTPGLRDFAEGYQQIRRAEGYCGRGAAYYRALPDVPATDDDAAIWAIRRKSFDHFRRILTGTVPPGGQVLDLGSGNGWLSHHIAALGYRPMALDINMDEDDGLRAIRHYSLGWPAVMSSFDALPLGDASVDLAVFNGSLHYGADIAATLAEAFRVLRPGGAIVVMDSPIYRDERSGKIMLEQRRAAHQAQFGFATEFDVEGYLTWDAVGQWAERFQCKLEVIRPWYGLTWALRPAKARLLGGREPASFALIVMTRQ